VTVGSAMITVRVTPRASRSSVAVDADGTVRAHLTAAPVDGAANRELVALLAKALRIPRRDVVITRGERGRDKVVAISGRSVAEVLGALTSRARDVDNSAGRG
jgi:uncharacterized protein (TIGR00251 family)